MAGVWFRTVTILHTTYDKPWCDYIKEKFKADKLPMKIETLDVTSLNYEYPPEIQTAIAESYAVMLVTTSLFLDHMEKTQSWFASMLEKRDKDITSVVAATIDVTFEELQLVTDKYNYNIDGSWEIMEIHIKGINIRECISKILEITDTNAAILAKRLPTRTFSEPFKHHHSKESILVIPHTVHKTGEKVALIFSNEKVEGSVSLHTGGVQIPVEMVNPYCVTFIAPEFTGTRITLQVDVDNIKLRCVKLFANPAPHFTSVELMCQSYGLTKKEDLDKKLAEKFTSSICDDYCAIDFLSDFRNSSSGRSESHYPTLLHWAAANGLKELCSAIISAPGASQACNILNRDGDDVSDLADKNGYNDLSDFIIEFMETKKIADNCDLYVQICAEPPDSPYEKMTVPIKPERTSGPPVLPRPPLPAKTFTLPPQTSPPAASSKPLPTPQEFLLENITEQFPLGAMGSRSQGELIEIQEEVKKGTFTIKEAELLFHSWKARYETGNAISFKEKQQSLHLFREQHKKTVDALKAKVQKEKKKGKWKPSASIKEIVTISDPIGMRPKYGKMLLHPERGDSTVSHDSGRYSDRHSNLSQISTSSEEAEQDDDKQLTRVGRSQSEKAAGRNTDYRKSNRELFLELKEDSSEIEESTPPPLPPRPRKPAAEENKPPVPGRKPMLPFKYV